VNETPYWLAFSLVPEIGSKRLLHLHQHFGDLASAWEADKRQLQAAGLAPQALSNLLRVRNQIDPAAELERVRQSGAWLLTWEMDEFPPLLREIDTPPVILYVRGTLTETDNRALAIVGTRRATNYGREAAYKLAQQLAAQGITIISGLAQGIDSAAHRGALDGGGRTIAVLGNGIDKIYPRENTPMAHEIVQNGAIISEFPLGTAPEARNFPRRNRVISGLSLGVLVVQAPERSGALITAHIAAEQGREVFAIPGNIFNTVSQGANRLIQDGAKLVTCAADILEELDIAHTIMQTRTQTKMVAPEDNNEARLLHHLSPDPIHIDELALLCGLPISTVSSTLTILELKGLARMVSNMQYSLVSEY